MKRLIQTRTHEEGTGDNCFATAIACVMDLDSPEDVWQVQEHYPDGDEYRSASWVLALSHWIEDRGYEWLILPGHLMEDEYYLVSGECLRGTHHVCVYKNGELAHDPHPSGLGLTTEVNFEWIRKSEQILQ